MRRNLLFVGALALLAGCAGGSTTSTGTLPTAAQLRAVPLSLGVSGKTLKGETFLWRDLMPKVTDPGDPAANTGVIVSFKVKSDDSGAVPGGLRAEKISIASGEDVWASTAIEITSDENSFGGVVRSGPEWPVGSSVDVVVTFRNSTGETFELRAVGQVVVGAY